MKISCVCDIDKSPGISCVKVNPWNDSVLVISTWSGTNEVYNTRNGSQLEKIQMNCPQLCIEWINLDSYASGGSDGCITIKGELLGCNNSPISCLAYVPQTKLLASGSWDGKVKLWNPFTKSCVFEYTTNFKIMCMTYAPPAKIICGCSEKCLLFIDTQNTRNIENKETLFHYQTRSIAATEGCFAIGVYEGRIMVKQTKQGGHTFGFHVHIKVENGIKTVYPVNALAFQPQTDYLATGGSDGVVSIWNISKKMKVTSLGDEENKPFNTSISSLSFSSDGNILAVAVSYCFEFGDIEHPPDRLIIYSSV